jgi:hypothetical protein
MFYQADYTISPNPEWIAILKINPIDDGRIPRSADPIKVSMMIEAENRSIAHTLAERQIEQEYPADEGYNVVALNVYPTDGSRAKYDREFRGQQIIKEIKP